MFLDLIFAGLLALKEYIALHILTCLIPAFLLAGAMVSFISKEAVKQLGIQAEITKVIDVTEFAKKGVMFTPGVIVDG
jgi:uncharacterized membrane protein YraQ (UPF0718 family)